MNPEGYSGSRAKILIVTHSAVTYTGLAEVTRNVFLGLLRRFPGQYELRQVGLFHSTAVTTVPWEITPTLTRRTSSGKQVYAREDLSGELTTLRLIAEYSPDIVFGFNDPQKLLHLCNSSVCDGRLLVLYASIDGVPVPKGLSGLLHADRFVTMSEFSKEAFRCSVDGLGKEIDVVYAPADTARFMPIPRNVREEMRADICPTWMNPGCFILGWVGRNQWRKQMWVMYPLIQLLRSGNYRFCNHCGMVAPKAIPNGHSCRCGHAEFEDAAPMMDVFLWIHLPVGSGEGDWPVSELERLYDVQAGRDVYYTDCKPDSHLSAGDMPKLYQLWDVLLMLSGGEGFGVPALEAMASGIPVVYSDYSSHAEVVSRGCAGLPVSGVLQPSTGDCILRLVADVYDAVTRVRNLYADRAVAQALGESGRRFAVNGKRSTGSDLSF